MHLPVIPEVLIGVAIFGFLILAAEIGYRLGLVRKRDREKDPNLGTIQGGLLGLLALLLGFAYAGATQRFIERQEILLRESNALGTAALRAAILPPDSRAPLLAHLRDYARDRLALFHEHVPAPAAEIERRLNDHHARAWDVAASAARSNPTLTNFILPPLNDVIDLLAIRGASAQRHLPGPVLVVLFGCAGVALFSLGYGQGMVGERQRATVIALTVLIAATLWITIDLDFPRRGLITLNPAPLETALAALEQAVASAPKPGPNP